MATRLRQLMILSRDVARSSRFYEEGLGLQILRQSDTFAEFNVNAGVTLSIKQAHGEAACSAGYSPFLNFDVYDMDETIPRLLMLGAAMDGPIKYPAFGKVAAVRSPDGTMIGLYESNTMDSATSV
ncbi:hypothetical protein SPRG_05474 [Saprolegnia parasitica CBS 223.65]|uniref:VOC domain-containing protein n=1 Tax=Saprolegnia parasitica (strain CBS 223.65) TaxID=695850 RepID=A0A067BN36_SAPPC|nr:hypothetical protein SPRG_05474 [Saprolegnia parasitica CBS 223.65]XP_012209634.1 hypothetical protein SPRG_14534 [Saprolegnia parasitica CBS 223.65]KDO19633.1 hypothetical protein SPRG_14534 [Saprolegnia parasitica CBS 223.65]KDO29517.1 hypothetical protein SPRG_05474 [Saprolegnia parasitica CBS 223.65]|eukprot:XP_012199583.1 hypothetical protein SPRG_05474 [Saprolegnia parasitica CBS 223.65]